MPQDSELAKKLKWCLKAGSGIALVDPSENLAKAYLEKSKTATRTMEVTARAGITDWFVSAGYYARYFAVYALFSKIGIKCENHECTIALFEYLFAQRVPGEIIDELRASKSDRIEAQYYTAEINIDAEGVMAQTRAFILGIDKIIDGVRKNDIESMRQRVRLLQAK